MDKINQLIDVLRDEENLSYGGLTTLKMIEDEVLKIQKELQEANHKLAWLPLPDFPNEHD